MNKLFLICLFLLPYSLAANAETAEMDIAKLGQLLEPFDPEPGPRAGIWSLQYQEFSVQVISDAKADRMRIVVPVARMADLDEVLLRRLLQANFDTALDARYAIAQDILWSTYIHPLSPLDEDELYAGLAQAITLASTFGSTYSSGALRFGGGDSGDELHRYYDKILERAKSI